MQILSAFGGGLWIIPIGLFLAACWSAYRGYRSSKSGSHYQDQATGKWVDTPGNIPFVKTGGGLFSIIFLAAAVISALLMWADR